MYLENQRHPRAGESFFGAAVRKLDLDVRYDADALARIPTTGPVVIVANHPYGVLDGIVISWLVEKVRRDFVVLTNAVLMRAPEVRDYHPADRLLRHGGGDADQSAKAAPPRARNSNAAASSWCFPPARFRRRRTAGPPPRGRRPLAAVRRRAGPARQGDGRADLVRRPEQPAVPDRQPSSATRCASR